MMPPKGMTPTELWCAVTTIPRPYRVVDFPRKHNTGPDEGKPIGQLAIVALTQQEQLHAGIAAEKLVRAELPDAQKDQSIGYEASYSNVCAVEQLWRACRVPTDLDRHIFPSPKEMRIALTTDEIGALYSAFLHATSEIGPMLSSLSKAEQDAWIDRLIAGGEADAIPFFSLGVLQTLARSMVARLRSLQTPPSSHGLQPDALSVDTSEDKLDVPDE